MGDEKPGNFYKQELIKTEKPEVFKIEKLLCRKKIKGKEFYLVKWQNYPEKFNSYEPAENIMHGKHGDKEVAVPRCGGKRNLKS